MTLTLVGDSISCIMPRIGLRQFLNFSSILDFQPVSYSTANLTADAFMSLKLPKTHFERNESWKFRQLIREQRLNYHIFTMYSHI